MRYLILSDIHGNREALDAVLEEASKDRYDSVLCLGDIVGYGADPNGVSDWVREHASAVVRGNHDKAAVGLDSLEWFNPAARASALWTRTMLTDENREWLLRLPRGPVPVADFQILHGSPLDEDEYLLNMGEVSQLVGYLERRVSFFGHTHVQGGFRLMRTAVRQIPPVPRDKTHQEVTLELDSEYLINPGSVGQPRDMDARSGWALYVPEDRLLILRRTNYNIDSAASKIASAGLPEVLARRLYRGQ